MMRACWIDAGNDPNYAKLAANRIAWPYFDAREPRLSATYLDTVVANPGIEGCGLYVVNGWFPALTPAQLAEWTHERLLAIGWQGNPPVMFDVEFASEPTKLVPYVLALLRRWRELRPKRITDLTLEGHQGGLFRPADVIAVVAQTRFTVPQCYNGAMSQVWDTWAMFMDLNAAGWPPAKVCPFYDAAHLPEWWGVPAGFAFTMGRLP